MSYGRISAVFQWALSNWQEFDAWCCINNVDPIDLPAYRFYNLSLYALKEGMEPEQLAALEETLRLCDSIKHPLHELLHVDGKKVAPQPSAKKDYVPSWWRGEQQAASTALSMMNVLPKKIGDNVQGEGG